MSIQSNFASSLEFQNRVLEIEGKQVWGASCVRDKDNKYHLFFSQWEEDAPHAAWVISCKVMHAVADDITGPYKVVGTALEGQGGDAWDAWSVHNPTVAEVDGKYVLLYMGSSGKNTDYTAQELSDILLSVEENPTNVPKGNYNIDNLTKEEFDAKMWKVYRGVVATKRVGMAIADTPYGPWKRVGNTPIIDAGETEEWDSAVTSNPAFIKSPDGKYMIYYKGWNIKGWYVDDSNANRQYGLATSDKLEGPYVKYENNPILDFSPFGNNAQLEDASVFFYKNQYHMIARDMGREDHVRGIIMSSDDGIHFNDPVKAYSGVADYTKEPIYGLGREGRYERAQIYMEDGKPKAMFTAAVGGKYKLSTSNLFLINLDKLNK